MFWSLFFLSSRFGDIPSPSVLQAILQAKKWSQTACFKKKQTTEAAKQRESTKI